MFTLWGKIKLDGTEAHRDARRLGRQIAREFGQQFRSSLRRFAGLGAIIGGAFRGIHEAEEIQRGAARMGLSTEAYQRLRQASDDMGVSPEELAPMIPRLGPEFREYIRGLRENRPLLDPEAIKALLAIRDAGDRILASFKLPPGLTGPPSAADSEMRKAVDELRKLREEMAREAEELRRQLAP